jgi:hypothetical protein
MKRFLITSALLLAGAAIGQPTNAPPAHRERPFHAHAAGQAKATPPAFRELKPNEIMVGKLRCSGIAAQLAKGENPLELINPAAPARYGSPEDNVVREFGSGKVTGLKIFSIRF